MTEEEIKQLRVVQHSLFKFSNVIGELLQSKEQPLALRQAVAGRSVLLRKALVKFEELLLGERWDELD